MEVVLLDAAVKLTINMIMRERDVRLVSGYLYGKQGRRASVTDNYTAGLPLRPRHPASPSIQLKFIMAADKFRQTVVLIPLRQALTAKSLSKTSMVHRNQIDR